jgi:hypothetical protein
VSDHKSKSIDSSIINMVVNFSLGFTLYSPYSIPVQLGTTRYIHHGKDRRFQSTHTRKTQTKPCPSGGTTSTGWTLVRSSHILMDQRDMYICCREIDLSGKSTSPRGIRARWSISLGKSAVEVDFPGEVVSFPGSSISLQHIQGY